MKNGSPASSSSQTKIVHWLRAALAGGRPACRLMALSAAFLTGCSNQAPSTVSQSAVPLSADSQPTISQSAEVSLAEQARAVRAGHGDEIRVELAVVGDAELAPLHDLPGLKKLILDRATVTDAGLARLDALPALEEVRIIGGRVGDWGLAHLCGLTALRRINLPESQITDNGLAALRQLPELIQLRLGSRLVTDAGMARIAELANLRFLHLIDMPLIDAGLDKLHGMKRLESFYLDGADGVTDQGLDRLLTALPDVHFHRDQRHRAGDPNADNHAPADDTQRP